MPIDAPTLTRLIDTELATVRDQRVVDYIRRLLVEPNVVMRRWDYGPPVDEWLPCWTILDDRTGRGTDTGIAYCEFGFGPRFPWGLVSMGRSARGSMSIGMDSGWFPTFMDAFFDSFAATPLPIWRVFTMERGDHAEPLTLELSHEEAWARVEEIRSADPQAKVSVHHTVAHGM